jgi:hypothetical protein
VLDFGHLPTGRSCDVQAFFTPGNTLSWVKPRGFTMLWYLLQGGGGGGGAGFTAATSTQRGGGGGGACGGALMGLCPLIILPDTLNVSVGAGGNPGSLGNGMGLNIPGFTISVTAIGGNGGATGTAAAGGAGGTTGSNSTAALFGITTSVANVAGGAGSASAAGSTAVQAGRTTSGAGGAGVTSGNVTANGGNQALIPGASNGFWAAPQGGAGGEPASSGANGLLVLPPNLFAGGAAAWNLLFGLGGAGGGSSGTTNGGNGGNGYLGGGGGGGGGGVTGGTGGRGGDGFALFICF